MVEEQAWKVVECCERSAQLRLLYSREQLAV
jgi:hypothetical protein